MDLDQDSPLSAILDFTTILDHLGFQYLIGGSFASSVHGEYRTTNDIDFLCSIVINLLPGFFKLLKGEFIVDEIMVKESVSLKKSFNIIHEKSFTKIDVFTKVGEYQNEQLSRAREISIPGISKGVKIASAEDTILSKLLWYKMGNEVSERQWKDIQGVLKVQGDKLDFKYLQMWAENIGVSQLLEKAKNE